MIIGIDTSCYTTSVAMIDTASGHVLLDSRKLLQVEVGEKGLRQSEAVFQHLKNLPELVEKIPKVNITAVAATTIPRPQPGSYLPVFKVGASFGETIAELLGIPLLKTSHQEGHIRAGLYNQKQQINHDFLAWHISGGTTELLYVQPAETGYQIQKIGGSSDLQIGQFIDRVGVALGTSFPAGPQLEKMALTSSTETTLPVVTQDLTISFSGPASAAERLISTGANGPDLARMVFNCITKALLTISIRAIKEFKLNQMLLVGGVASNQIVRETLVTEGLRQEIEFIFGPKELSSDNAVGVGLIGFDYMTKWKGTSNG